MDRVHRYGLLVAGLVFALLLGVVSCAATGSGARSNPVADRRTADGLELVELRHAAVRADGRADHRRDGVLGHARRRLPLRQPRRRMGGSHPRRRRQPARRPRPLPRGHRRRCPLCARSGPVARVVQQPVQRGLRAGPADRQRRARGRPTRGSSPTWGVDYLKYDWCRLDADHDEQVKYFTAMRDALRASGRRILYSINPNSSGVPDAGTRYDWSAIADLSRNFIDLVPSWGDDALWAQGLTGVGQAVHRGGAAGARAAAPARERPRHAGGGYCVAAVRHRPSRHGAQPGPSRPQRRRTARALLAVGHAGRAAAGRKRRACHDTSRPATS